LRRFHEEARKAQEAWTTRFLKKKFASICILQTVHPNDDVEIEWCNVTPEHLRILETLGLRLIELPERLAGHITVQPPDLPQKPP
jgi:hypothetical protein